MASKPRLRLTRRGRFVLFLLFLGLSVAMVAVAASASRAADPAGERPTVVVHQGDTLWSIASRHGAGRDPVAAIEEIRRLNDLDGYAIYAGQELTLPHRR
ncbi:LysM peptidoglycan-binding domain-containing protein [Actinomycetes bacterium KLBMP 9797]